MNSKLNSSLVHIPVIDFQSFVTNDKAQQQITAKQIYQACHEVGFMYLKNHGIAKPLLEQVFLQTRQFFDLPLEVKNQLAWSSEFSNRGYVGIERERLDPNQPGDLKEAFNVGKEGAEVTSLQLDNPALTVNQWPPNDELFRQTILEFFEACSEAANLVFQAFALALQLPPSFIIDKHANQEHVLRLLHYPPITQELKPGQVRAGTHSDYGSLTLLFQDDIGGLEVQTATGDWRAAPFIPDTVLVNTGDLMQRWSNDRFRSTKHRVIPSAEKAQKHRYSIAFFCQPDYNAEITCIESCQGPDNPARYPTVLAGEYLISLLQATY